MLTDGKEIHKNADVESSFVTLEAVVERAISSQGPFSRFSGAFDQVAQLSWMHSLNLNFQADVDEKSEKCSEKNLIHDDWATSSAEEDCAITSESSRTAKWTL